MKKITNVCLLFLITLLLSYSPALYPADEVNLDNKVIPNKVIPEKTKPSSAKEPKKSTTANKDNEKQKNKLPKEEEKEEKKNIYLNFENAEISNFVNYIAEIKDINLIPDEKLVGKKISLTIREGLTAKEAWKVFLTVLEMTDFSIVKRGKVQVVIPKSTKVRQPLKSYINVPLEQLPNSDLSIRFVTFLENINVSQVQPMLKDMLSKEAQVWPYTKANGMVITGKSHNIKAAMRVVQELDQTGLQEAVVVMRLKIANAPDVKQLFDDLIKQPQQNPLARLLGKQAEGKLRYFSPSTRIIAEPRTNSLILMGNKKSIQKIEDFIVNHIDTELKQVESPLHVYELQHTDATAMKEILTNVVAPPPGEETYGAVRGGVKYFKGMSIKADTEGNRLLVSVADKHDWALLKKTIIDLDKPQPQCHPD